MPASPARVAGVIATRNRGAATNRQLGPGTRNRNRGPAGNGFVLDRFGNLRGFGTALNHKPTPQEDEGLPAIVAGKSGGEGLAGALRYGGPAGIALCERLFHADSEAVLAVAPAAGSGLGSKL